MTEIVRILLLEDTISDAQLAEREIRKVLKNSEIKQVETKKEFTQALINFDPELIISDYNLPSFNGLEALKIKQEIKPEIPLIIFTGSINEDTAPVFSVGTP
jgi:DNA-binding NtrC family response regulator